MRKRIRKLLSGFICAAMVITSMPGTANAGETGEPPLPPTYEEKIDFDNNDIATAANAIFSEKEKVYAQLKNSDDFRYLFESQEDGVSIEVTAPAGSLPENISVNVERLKEISLFGNLYEYYRSQEANDLAVTRAFAYQISFLNNGELYEPEDGIVNLVFHIQHIYEEEEKYTSVEMEYVEDHYASGHSICINQSIDVPTFSCSGHTCTNEKKYAYVLYFTQKRTDEYSHFEIDETTLVRYSGRKSIVEIPDGVEIIKEDFDENCIINTDGDTYVKQIVIPTSVKKIEDGAFGKMPNLEEIVIKEGNNYYQILDGALFETDSKKLMAYPASREGAIYNIPDIVKVIGFRAFGCNSKIEELTLPDSVLQIEEQAFADSTGLHKVTIGTGLSSLYACIFNNTPNLEEIIVNEKNPYFYSRDGVLLPRNGDYLWFYPSAKKDAEYAIPDGIKEVRFSNNPYLKKLNIPKTVISLMDLYWLSLDEIILDVNNTSYVLDECALYTYDKSKLVYCIEAKAGDMFLVPADVTKSCDLRSIHSEDKIKNLYFAGSKPDELLFSKDYNIHYHNDYFWEAYQAWYIQNQSWNTDIADRLSYKLSFYPTTKGYEILSDSKKVKIGDSLQLRVAENDFTQGVIDNEIKPEKWEVTDSDNKIDQNGLFMAVAKGKTKVCAYIAGITEPLYIDIEVYDFLTEEEYNALKGITLNHDFVSLKTGESILLQTNELIPRNEITWTSSDETCVTVNAGGKAHALAEGVAEITATWGEMKAVCTVEVSENGGADPDISIIGIVSNIGKQNYSRWSAPMQSYLADNGNGTFTRVESIKNRIKTETNNVYDYSTQVRDKILVETYRYDGTLVSQNAIDMELDFFGGFYSGETYNFLVFGQNNEQEDDNREVIRVVRYTKNWERDGAARLFGVNTVHPFDAGSLRMTEYGGRLYVRTCHEMDADSDGVNHQANLTFMINEDTLQITDQFYLIWGEKVGYVSHSFNQFIITDGPVLLAADHGDGGPRAVALFQYREEAGGDTFWSKGAEMVEVLRISGGTGVNPTGVSIGGLEATGSSYLIAGNSIDQHDESKDYTNEASFEGVRNIFVTSTPKDEFTEEATETYWITEYSGEEKVSTPHLVKINKDRLLLLYTVDDILNYVYLNGKGEPIGSPKTAYGKLSDCAPIVINGEVIWYYTTEDSQVHFCRIGKDIKTISLNETSVVMTSGAEMQLFVNEVIPYDEVEWKSSNDACVKVDEHGNIQALVGGKAVITASCNGLSASCEVTVIDGITLNYAKKDLRVGETLQLEVLEDIPKEEILWMISAWGQEKAVTIDNNGMVSAVCKGWTQISASWKGYVANCDFTVTDNGSGSSGGSSGGGSGGSSGGSSGGASGGSGGGSGSSRPSGGGSSGGGGSSSGSGGSRSSASGASGGSASASTNLPAYVIRGTWVQNAAGAWNFYDNAGQLYTSCWAAVYNPYANTAAGAQAFDWFRFDANGLMVTGWFTDEVGDIYYLHPVSDGTQGRMYTGWQWIDSNGDGAAECYYFEEASNGYRGRLYKSCTTPDGYIVNEKGQWVDNGKVVTR